MAIHGVIMTTEAVVIVTMITMISFCSIVTMVTMIFCSQPAS